MRISDIIQAAAIASPYSADEIIGPRRTPDLAHWRACAMCVARQHTGQSLPQIGRAFQRDHTTVLYAVRRADALDQERIATIESIAAKIKDARVASYTGAAA